MILELKTLSPNHDYQRTIVAMLSIPFDPKQGYQGAEILAIKPLRDKIETAGENVELTDEEHAEICRRMLNGHYSDDSDLTFQMLEDICKG